MSDFLSDVNNCGQTIVRLVSRGNAIIAELLRLANFIPPEFIYNSDLSKEDREKMELLLPNFDYFQKSDYIEARIDQSSILQSEDEEMRENLLEIITRFYLAFESVYKYVNDLNKFLEELEEGVFVQQTLESVMINDDGKQLMCEALYLYGVMLLIIEDKFEAEIRERILVCYYRYSTSASNVDTNIDDVCKLIRSTGYVKLPGGGTKRPQNYPESYFARIPINQTYINMAIGRLRSDDIYAQIAAYPSPDHRSVALSNQAAMLYVILYFNPLVLFNQQAKMREIVDKHFPDNWVISIYMGMIVNLIDAWEPYKAAKTALNNTLEIGNIQEHALKHIMKLEESNKQVLKFLKVGTLIEDFILDNINRLLNCLREANVTLRWLILHTAETPECIHHKRCKQMREMVINENGYNDITPFNVFDLLTNTAQLEFVLSEMFKHLLNKKETKWLADKDESSSRLTELGEVFSGQKPLTRVEPNSNLQAWFEEMAKQIDQLSYEDSTSAGRKIVQLIQAMVEVLEFHQLEQNLQVKQFLLDVQLYLKHMLRTINIKEETLVILKIVSDLSFAWLLIDSYTPYMQEGIKNNPQVVIKLRATFLKLASALDFPLVRIHQVRSQDLISVSKYYSDELVNYVRKVLQIIPQSMFAELAKIIKLQTDSIKEVPTKLDKEKMKEYAQLDDRYKVAELTRSISVFTEGILMMKTTLVGIIKVDPKQLLEDGIRKELVNKVASALHWGLIFNSKSKTSELEIRLKELSAQMSGYLLSFEYIQDYVDIYGLKIWQQEVSRIINFNVEQECNSFLRKQIYEWDSYYQSTAIPIPKFHRVDYSVNFIGRLAREILRITDYRTTCYVPQMRTWYDRKSYNEIVSIKLWESLLEAVDTFGLSGLDRLFCFMIVRELQGLKEFIFKDMLHDKNFAALLSSLSKTLYKARGTISEGSKSYMQSLNKTSKFWPLYADKILKVGQLQLLRKQIAHKLRASCKFDSKLLMASLECTNSLLLADIKAHYKNPVLPYPGDDNPLMYELTPYLEETGLHEPLSKIYITTQQTNDFSLINFLFILSQLSKLCYLKKIGGLVAKRQSDLIDGPPFLAGIVTLMRQYHSDVTEEFLQYMCQYVRSLVLDDATREKSSDILDEVLVTLTFVEEFIAYSGFPRDRILNSIPSYLFDEFKTFAI